MGITLGENEIREVLSRHFDDEVTNLEPIATGQISEPYSFDVENESYVIRFAAVGQSGTLYKDRYVSEQLVNGIPVAEFVCVQDVGDRTYAISKRAAGSILDEFEAADYENLIPDLIHVLDRIHQTDIASTSGWGDFDETGTGRWHSFQDYLSTVDPSVDVENYYWVGWQRLFEDSYLDRDLFEEAVAVMKEQYSFIPKERYLLHRDFGFDNVLAEGDRVTAVIDWAIAAFGDFVLDIALLDVHMPQWNWADRFEAYYCEQERTVPNYRERMLCYSCYLALDGMRFFASRDVRPAYDATAARLRSLIKNF